MKSASLDMEKTWLCKAMGILFQNGSTLSSGSDQVTSESFSANIVLPIWSIERKISGEIIVLSFVTLTQLLNQCLFQPAYRELIAPAGSLRKTLQVCYTSNKLTHCCQQS